jgi:hypothetical protein
MQILVYEFMENGDLSDNIFGCVTELFRSVYCKVVCHHKSVLLMCSVSMKRNQTIGKDS